MARYTTYKSGIVSGSNLVAASIATSRVFGTASYVLNANSASFARNASGSWLSSSFGTTLSALSVIGFNTDGTPLTVYPAQDSLYLTVVDGIIGWTTLDSAIYDSAITEDSLFTELGVYSQSLNYANPNILNSNFFEISAATTFSTLSGSLVNFIEITSYTTSSI